MSTRLEVAHKAGVSVRTVSNVVNGFEQIAPATRARVLDAIRELGYQPNEVARSLRTGRSGLIGLMLPEIDIPYFAELTRAFVAEGRKRGWAIVVDHTDGNLDQERAFVQRAARGGLFDATVLSPLALAPDDASLLGVSAPMVLLGEKRFPAFDQVMIDNVAASRQIVQHLVDRGKRRIAVVGFHPSEQGTSSERFAGYKLALQDAGLELNMELVPATGPFGRVAGAAATRELLALHTPPDAVFAFSDPLALGAMRVVHEHHHRVPEDIAVAGFDDNEEGRFSIPTLTTISPDKEWLARTSLDRIERRLDGEQLPRETLIGPFALRIRESTTASA